MRFLARVIAELRALIQDSFSSGLTARKIRFGAYKRGNSGQCQWLNSYRDAFTLSLPTEELHGLYSFPTCLSGKMQSRPNPPVLQNGTGLPHTAPGLSASWQPFAKQTMIPYSTQLFKSKAVYHIYFPRGCSSSFPLFALPHTILDFALIKRWCSLSVHLLLTCDLSVATSDFDRVC